jgi:hypothetical protein
MPSHRQKPPDEQKFLKRRTFERGKAELDAAHIAAQRLYCTVLKFWRRCKLRPCRRHRRCLGEPTRCLLHGIIHVPQAERLKAQKQVIAGGPQRLAPATHIEWFVRRTELKSIVMWGLAPLPEETSAGIRDDGVASGGGPRPCPDPAHATLAPDGRPPRSEAR